MERLTRYDPSIILNTYSRVLVHSVPAVINDDKDRFIILYYWNLTELIQLYE